jgi:NifU-like protein involved in Fe-S cluster formation
MEWRLNYRTCDNFAVIRAGHTDITEFAGLHAHDAASLGDRVAIVIDRDPLVCLKAQGGRIAAAKYHAVRCGPTIASGSMLTEMITGSSIAECREVTVKNLIEALDRASRNELRCPAPAHRGAQGCVGETRCDCSAKPGLAQRRGHRHQPLRISSPGIPVSGHSLDDGKQILRVGARDLNNQRDLEAGPIDDAKTRV